MIWLRSYTPFLHQVSSDFHFQDGVQIGVILVPNVPNLCPKFGQMPISRVTQDRDNSMARAEFLCHLDSSNTCVQSAVY